MSILEILVLLLIAAVSGGIAQALVGFSGGGCLISIVVGFIGALLGSWISREMGLPEPFELNIGGQPFPVLWSIIGGALFAGVLSLLSPKRSR